MNTAELATVFFLQIVKQIQQQFTIFYTSWYLTTTVTIILILKIVIVLWNLYQLKLAKRHAQNTRKISATRLSRCLHHMFVRRSLPKPTCTEQEMKIPLEQTGESSENEDLKIALKNC